MRSRGRPDSLDAMPTLLQPTTKDGTRSSSEQGYPRSLDVSAAISVRGLRKSYGNFNAVNGIDFDVQHGEIVAFLGPNGAGKTTTVEILEGYRKRIGGDVRVLGEDPASAHMMWRDRIGIVLQDSQIEPDLTAKECVELYAGYHLRPRSVSETLVRIPTESEQ